MHQDFSNSEEYRRSMAEFRSQISLSNQSSIFYGQIRLIHQPNFGALGVNRYVNSAIQRKILPAVTKEERFQSVAVPEPTLVYG
jgi:hypothetical protein